MLKLFDSEFKVMEVLWREKSVAAKDIAKELYSTVGWDKTTTYTILRRCVEKKLISRKDPNFICEALVSKEQVRFYETEELLERMYDGETSSLVAFLLDKIDVSNDEILKIKEIIDNLDV